MRNLEIDSQTTLIHILSELKSTEEDGLELSVLPGEKVFLTFQLTKKLLKR